MVRVSGAGGSGDWSLETESSDWPCLDLSDQSGAKGTQLRSFDSNAKTLTAYPA